MDQSVLHRLRRQDRTDLETLLGALNGAKNAIRLDDCGDWMIDGSRGDIRACKGTFSLFLSPGSARGWTNAKTRLADLARASQDGDDEGILQFTRMPSEVEAEIIRHYLGLRQTREAPSTAFRTSNDPDPNGL